MKSLMKNGKINQGGGTDSQYDDLCASLGQSFDKGSGIFFRGESAVATYGNLMFAKLRKQCSDGPAQIFRKGGIKVFIREPADVIFTKNFRVHHYHPVFVARESLAARSMAATMLAG